MDDKRNMLRTLQYRNALRLHCTLFRMPKLNCPTRIPMCQSEPQEVQSVHRSHHTFSSYMPCKVCLLDHHPHLKCLHPPSVNSTTSPWGNDNQQLASDNK